MRVYFFQRRLYMLIYWRFINGLFISSSRQFCHRRGKCSDIYLDIVKHFVDVNRYLLELRNLFQPKKRQDTLQNILIELRNLRTKSSFIFMYYR